ncbi:hypothetical protein ABAC460_21250 [Asticcacaulis sp. AC460]|uniref:LysR family transcriptional regulator n=1 Tax=Asticcacaulis sp. AC460 TaxID=1282360 RepID=UPI0003C3B1D3|nr:LysR family transcriptional regulator [Asticcacaulis sp. AC460]ESQ87099.1 hypothetical protein ABAC460_21250 [Asticcacaulis sp. AC460]
MRYDLNLLPVFVALMEERNVSRAAERLGITQPALSNALNRLRETMRDPLFIRERYGMKPTQMAEALAPVIQSALAGIDDAVRGQQDFDPAQSTRMFTIASNSYVEYVLMPTIVARLRERAPDVRLRLIPFANDPTEAGAMSGDTDLVLGRIVDAPDNLVVQHLMDDGLACMVRTDHPDVHDTLSRAEYEALKHVNVLPPGGRLRAGLFVALEQKEIKREVAVSVTHFLAVPEMIAATDYCTTLPARISHHLARDPRLKVVPAPVDFGTFPVQLAWHVRYRHDPAHRWLRALIAEMTKDVVEATS